jgi:flagellar hook-length control protein FliK
MPDLPAGAILPAASDSGNSVVGPSPQDGPDPTHEMLAVRIGRAIQNGQSTVSVELQPAELGRVEVHLSFHSSGVGVQITIDRRETFDAFTRDRAGLEQQLSQAGIDLGGGGLDLRHGQQSGQSSARDAMAGHRFAAAVQQPVATVRPASATSANSLIDILA